MDTSNGNASETRSLAAVELPPPRVAGTPEGAPPAHGPVREDSTAMTTDNLDGSLKSIQSDINELNRAQTILLSSPVAQETIFGKRVTGEAFALQRESEQKMAGTKHTRK